jgi:hypothetical protein
VPKKRQKEQIACPFFSWLLGQRNGVFFADGRSNLGRHSLGTRDRFQAIENLKTLDRLKAVEFGLIERSFLDDRESQLLDLEKGRHLYMTYVRRPAVAGGAGETTYKRYRAVFGKFIPFAVGQGLTAWNHVTKNTLTAYAAWLDGESYAYASEYLELTTLKQAIKWFIAENHLPESALIRLPLQKPTGTDT